MKVKELINEILNEASHRGYKEIVTKSILAGADVNFNDSSAIINAAYNCETSIIRELLEAGSKPHSSALYWGVRNGKEGIVEMLLEAGADANSSYKDPNNMTILDHAINRNDIGIIKLLKQYGAEL